jgi:hypothetical protein
MAILEVGKVFEERWAVKELLPESGQGQVAFAHDPVSSKEVSIKLAPPGSESNPVTRVRFELEGQLGAEGIHPVPYVAGSKPGAPRPYVVFRRVPGRNLQDLLDDAWVPTAELAVHVLSVLVAQLTKLHRAGIVHRDVTSRNVVVAPDTGETHLIDLGIAFRSRGERLTREGGVGTPGYIAPEILDNPWLVTPQADQFALGVTLYHLLTNEGPFGVANTDETIHHTRFEEPVPIEQRTCHYPNRLCRVIHRMMAKSPAGRYRHLADALDDLESATYRGDAGRRRVCLACGAAAATRPICPGCGVMMSNKLGLLFGGINETQTLFALPLGSTIVRRDRIAPGNAHVSREHFRVEVQGDIPRISDLGSKNGTYVNRRRIKSRLNVIPHTPIEIGHLRGRFVPFNP